MKSYLLYKRVPQYISRRIMSFYDFMLTRVQSLDQDTVLKDLPFSLRLQLAIVLNNIIGR